MKILKMPTRQGVRSRLDYRYAGGRYRPVLGYDLTSDQEKAEAARLIALIHARVSTGSSLEMPAGPTFAEFAGDYLKFKLSRKLADPDRPQVAVLQHLVPVLGHRPMRALSLNDGLDYLAHRRREGAAEGTILKECNELMALCAYAVAVKLIAESPMSLLPRPRGVERDRVVEPWELWRLLRINSTSIGRMVLAGLLVPLREAKLVACHVEWQMRHAFGWAIHPSPGSRLKGVPKVLPIGQLAVELLHGPDPRLRGRFFAQWATGASFRPRMLEACDRAGVHDLHFHDLRHTAFTWLHEAGVDYAVINMMAGHKVPGMTAKYIHRWEGRMAEAAKILEATVLEKMRTAMHDERGFPVPPAGRQGSKVKPLVGTSWALQTLTHWCQRPVLALPNRVPTHAVSAGID